MLIFLLTVHQLSLSPKLDQFLKTRSLLIDEALPDAEYLVASPASFRPLSILAPKTGYSRFSGKVLQPLFETVDIGLRDRTVCINRLMYAHIVV